MADKKRYEVVRGGPVGGYAPGEKFDADPDDSQVQQWVASGAVKALAVQKVSRDKDADKR